MYNLLYELIPKNVKKGLFYGSFLRFVENLLLERYEFYSLSVRLPVKKITLQEIKSGRSSEIGYEEERNRQSKTPPVHVACYYSFSTTTAVPYAKTSVTPCIISLASYRIAIIALAPITRACSISN